MILGIETVTKIGSLVIVEDAKILGQITIDTQLRHTANLISSLDNLLKSIGVGISNIDAISVDIGPGSFTGIRVGIATARGLAQPDNKLLIGICSLEVLCYKIIEIGIEEDIEILVPVIDAKRGLFYSASYKVDNGRIEIVKEPYLTTIDLLNKEKPKDSLIFGPEIDNTYPDAGVVALIAERKIKEGLVEKDIEPMYVHGIEYRLK